MSKRSVNNQSKISPEFAARLTQLEPQEKVHAIVLLQVKEDENNTGKRPSRIERQANMKALQESAKYSLETIDGIIKLFDGHSLVEHPDLLGSIPIEIAAAGINALVKSDAVKAVIEDQTIYPGHSNNSIEIRFGKS